MPPTRQHHGLTLAVLLVAVLAFSLQHTMVAPALPAIQDQLETSTTAVTYVLTVFLLTASISTPILGRLGDMFGKKRVLIGTLATFAVGTLICALSSTIAMLIAGRAIQGTAAAVFPLAYGIIRDEFPPERVSTAIGLISAAFGIGAGTGLVVSGLIVDYFDFAWIFWIGFGGTVAAVAAALLWIPESPVKSPARVDWIGAGMLSATLVTLLVAISEANAWGWGSTRILGLFAAAVVLFGLWVAFERRQPHPLVDIELMRQRAVLTTNLTALFVGFGMFGSFILIPQLVQLPESTGFGFGASVTEAGLFMAPSAASMLLFGPVAGWLVDRVDPRLPLLFGTMAISASFLVLLFGHQARGWIYCSSLLTGIGIAFSFAASINIVVQAVHPLQTGVATGINTIMRTIGGSLGGQIAASVVAAHAVAATGLPDERGFELAFGLSAAVMVLAFLTALAIPRRLPFTRRDAELVAEEGAAGSSGSA